ncbi:hypothetical protein Q8A67_025417 [Cirrhinus molitorella]|uniref:Uncharacterized protein n=1 Tax=Cirrhinus molitorella TaxID=172907 RepID=A0AA88THT6_9TELE|nr:hypothetical protein Q8A67_025417 [Cirrhinus molitorella]
MGTQGVAFDLLFHDLPGMSFLLTLPPLLLLAHWLSAAGLMTRTARTEHARAVTSFKASALSSRGCHGDDFANGPPKMSAALPSALFNLC